MERPGPPRHASEGYTWFLDFWNRPAGETRKSCKAGCGRSKPE